MKFLRTPTTALVHDTRTQKKNGTYPVKIRVTFGRKQKYYPTDIDLTEEDYNRVFGEKPRKEMKALRLELEAKEQKAVGIIKEIPRFSFEAFERKFVICADDRLNVFAAYRHTIHTLYQEDRVGNASSYACSQKSIQSFVKRDTLSFELITVDFLKAYEKWMLQDGNSLTTVGIYIRPLRALFNQAIREGIIAPENYPFGKGRYQIPAGRNVKKALSLTDIEKIFKHPVPEGSTEQWARDLWVFSYLCNGINVKDIARLRYHNIGNEVIEFVRAKTEHTTRKNLKPVLAVLTPEIKAIINRWGQKPAAPHRYVFSILPEGVTAKRERALIQQATKTINLYCRRIAEAAGIAQDITTYTARHSFASVLKRSGVSTEFISESLGHSDLKTTENYLAAFDESVKKEHAAKLTAFMHP